MVKNSDPSEKDGATPAALVQSCTPTQVARPARLRPPGLGYGCKKKCSFLINNKYHEAIAPSHLVRDVFSLACAVVDLSHALPLHGGGPEEQQCGAVAVPVPSPYARSLAAAAATFGEDGGRMTGETLSEPCG